MNQDEDNKLSELEDQFKQTLEKVRLQNLLLGAQSVCSVVLDKIVVTKRKPGKTSMNDYRRLVDEIESFCRTGLSRKVNQDGSITKNEEESVQD